MENGNNRPAADRRPVPDSRTFHFIPHQSGFMTQIHLHEHTRREFRQRLEAGEIQACIIPTGAIEQHLEHLAMEHDWRSVSEIAASAAERLSPAVIIASGVMAGISEHHMRHPGTLSLRPATFLAVLGDLISSIHRTGITNILVVNGHGGNVAPCRAVWDQFQREFPGNLQFLPYWELLNAEDAKLLSTGKIPGHAQEFETALAAFRFPENIRETAMRDQVDPSPTEATAATGKILFERIVERLTDHLRAMISGDSQVEPPAYFP